MDLPGQLSPAGVRELTLDLSACGADAGHDRVLDVLAGCPGVRAAYVDQHVTWALTSYGVDETSPAAIVAHLAAAGLVVQVNQVFDDDVAPLRPAQA